MRWISGQDLSPGFAVQPKLNTERDGLGGCRDLHQPYAGDFSEEGIRRSRWQPPHPFVFDKSDTVHVIAFLVYASQQNAYVELLLHYRARAATPLGSKVPHRPR